MPKIEIKPRVKLDERYRIVIPQVIRQHIEAQGKKLKPATIVEIELYGRDKILLTILG